MKKNLRKSTRNTRQSSSGAVRFRIPPYRIEQVVSDPLGLFTEREKSFEALWKTSTGKGIKVAVLDTGIDDRHPALQQNIAAIQDFTSSTDGFMDAVGHGTHVAGIIAAQDKIGVAPGVSIHVGKVMQHMDDGDPEDLVAGIKWAASQGVDIINLSLGSLDVPPPKVYDAISLVVSSSIFVICAAGNGGNRGLDFPARFGECIAVGALDSLEKHRWQGTAQEGQSAKGLELDIVARGESILSTIPGGQFGRLSGTSMAAPFVSGVIALTLAKQRSQSVNNPITTVQQLLERLRETSKDIGPTGKDDEFGFGKIDQERLINSVM